MCAAGLGGARRGGTSAAEEAALERGADVRRISPSVQQVHSSLRRRDLPNTPQGRAAAIAHLGATSAAGANHSRAR